MFWVLYKLFSSIYGKKQVEPELNGLKSFLIPSDSKQPEQVTIEINQNNDVIHNKSVKMNEITEKKNNNVHKIVSIKLFEPTAIIQNDERDQPTNQVMTIANVLNKPKRYLDVQDNSDGVNDKILHESLSKSLASSKSLPMREIKSYQSRKSTGFEPSISTIEQTIVEPLKKQSGNSFLEILNRLNETDREEDELERKERERRKRRREQRVQSISPTGIEAGSSDETASQTFIGKEFESRPNPGKILLGLIKAQNN